MEKYSNRRRENKLLDFIKLSYFATVPSSLVQQGDKSRVALLLSVSGKIGITQLPTSITSSYCIYEICPKGRTPSRNIVRTEKTLDNFRFEYENALRKIEREHKAAKKILLFPAIPVSISILCGSELLKNVSKTLSIFDKMENSYKLIMEVN